MAKQKWTVKGKLWIAPQLADIEAKFGDTVPLAGVTLKVSAREKLVVWGPWNKWDEVTTKNDGSFSIKKDKDKSKRQFKVDVIFKDKELKIYPDNDGLINWAIEKLTDWNPITDYVEDALEQAVEQMSRVAYDVKWFTVYKDRDGQKHSAGTLDLGDLVFQKGGGEDRGKRNARCHAEIWFLYKEVIAYLKGLGKDFGFPEKKPIAIKYPHSNPLIGDRIEASYANPENYLIHIIKNTRSDDFEVQTLIHELMHIWAYQHCTREKGLAWQLIIHGSTHTGRQNKTWVPFHEAFAEWSSNFIFQELFGTRATIYGGEESRFLPFGRDVLRAGRMTTLGEVDHYENGWISLFNTLIARNLDWYDLNTGDPYVVKTASVSSASRPPQQEFKKVLQVFCKNEKAGHKGYLKRSEMSRTAFLARMVDVVSDFTETDKKVVNGVVNPKESKQYQDLTSSPTTSARVRGSTATRAKVTSAKKTRGKKPISAARSTVSPDRAKTTTKTKAKTAKKARRKTGKATDQVTRGSTGRGGGRTAKKRSRRGH